jgi:hypothetical protein
LNFKRPVDGQRAEVIPETTEVIQGFVSAPLLFKAMITPRDAQKADIIQEE